MNLLNSVRRLFGGGDATPLAAPPDARRRHRRIQTVKLTILIGKRRYKTRDWSLGGFRIAAPDLAYRSNQPISGKLNGPGLFDSGEFEGVISWVSEQGEIGVRLTEVSRESFAAMSRVQN